MNMILTSWQKQFSNMAEFNFYEIPCFVYKSWWCRERRLKIFLYNIKFLYLQIKQKLNDLLIKIFFNQTNSYLTVIMNDNWSVVSEKRIF